MQCYAVAECDLYAVRMQRVHLAGTAGVCSIMCIVHAAIIHTCAGELLER